MKPHYATVNWKPKGNDQAGRDVPPKMHLRVLREGLFPLLEDADLRILRDGMAGDDQAILQGTTIWPNPSGIQFLDMTCECGCPISFIGMRAKGLRSVKHVGDWFTDVCDAIDRAFNEPAACRYLLNYIDDNPRDEVFAELITEIDAELARRATLPAPPLALPVEMIAETYSRR